VSAIDTLFAAVNGLFAHGLRNATLVCRPIRASIALNKPGIDMKCFMQQAKIERMHPDLSAISLPWGCCTSAIIPILYAGPRKMEDMQKAILFAMFAEWNYDPAEIDSGEETEMGSEQDIVEAIDLLRQAVMNSTESVVGVICVRLTNKQNIANVFGEITFIELQVSHVLTIAIAKEGIRVFQGMMFGTLSVYRLDEYIRMAGARLRGWDEANVFISQLDVLSKSVRLHFCSC
jgi:hypothetical protein